MNNRWLVLVIMISVLIFWGVSQAQENWVYRYNGPGNNKDSASAVVYGADGNIYVAGASVGSGTYSDFTVISLTSSGTERWVYRYNGPGGNYDDLAFSLVYGTDGNIYAAGAINGDLSDFGVISLTNTGTERWVYQYSGGGAVDDAAYSVVYGADSNIYAAGLSKSGDFVVISLTNTGTERWVYEYSGPGNWATALSIVYGADGNIYAAGWSHDTNRDFTVISLTSSGTERWVYRYNGPGDDSDEAFSLVYGADGNIYAAGYSLGNGTNADFLVISLTNTGTERWVYRHNGPDNDWDELSAVVYGLDGNIYAAGASDYGATLFDFTVISLTNTGTERWVYQYNNPGDWYDWARSLVYGADSNIYAAGYSSGTEYDFVVIKLTSTGTEHWVYRYNGPGDSKDVASAIIYGADNNIYAGGGSTGSGTEYDFTVISLPNVGIKEQCETSVRDYGLILMGIGKREIKFSLTLSEPTVVDLSLYNIIGEKVCSFKIPAEKGTSYHKKSLPFFSSGIYFLKAEIEGNTITKKVIVLQ